MKKSFMTRALAMGLSLAMAFSLSAATNVSVASAASKPAMASKQFAVRVGGAAKSYKASAATQKSYKITKATVGNTDKATVKVNSSKKSIKVTPGTVTGTTVVTVTFKNIKTAKSTAKKYRCVVKAALEEKPVEPEVVKATKITEAKASTAKTVSVTFDGVVDTTSATSIKLMRGTTEATVTAAYASDAKSVTLTSATPLAAGTYTLTVGSFEPVSFNVVKQTPTKLQITSTTVANTDGAGVGFQVLDQYGEPMTDYTAKKLVVTAYNATKGHSIKENVDLSKPYFTLDCATQDVNGKVINALGDKISVVAYLKDNASVSTTAELTITNIYMESLEFGEPELGKEKRVTVNKTYKLPYTAKTNEGNNATFAKVGKKASTVSRPFGDYTFVTSNISALDMGNIEVDKDGNMFFTAGGTAGTAVITAINTKTGTTVSTTIVVNDVPTLSRLDVADASIAWNAADNTEVKAAVTAYDQFDEVIDAKDIKNVKFDNTINGVTKIANMFSSVTRVPNDANANIVVDRFSNDGKYLIYKKTGALAVGRNITFNFTSAKTGANGYITFKSIVEVNDRIEPGALTIVTEPDATKQEGQTVKVQFSVLDQYQNKVNLVLSGSALRYHAPRQDAVNATDYLVEAECKGAVTGLAAATLPATNPTVVAGTDNKVGQFEFNLNGPIDELYKDGEITLKLTEGGDQIDAKKFAVKVVKTVSDYDVATDKTAYKAGDTVTVTVNAYSNVGGLKFNRHYNGKHDVEVELYDKAGNVIANSKTRKTLEFKDGVATFTMTAGAATAPGDNRRYKVTQIGGPATTNADFFAAADGFTVATNSSNKIAVDKALNKLRIVDSQGNKITAGSGTSYATVVVMDETLGKDITSNSKITSNGSEIKLDNKTAKVDLLADKVIDKIANVNYNLSTGFSIDAPATSANSNISISITVDGCTWKGVEKANGNGDVTIKDAGAVEAAAVAEIKAFLDDMTNATATAVSGTAVDITVTPSALTVTGDSIIKAITGSAVQVATSAAFSSYPKYATNKITATTKTDGGNAENDDYTFTIEFEIGANDTNGVLVVRKADVKVSYKFTGANVVAKVESATLKN